jgi:hypothetical protein
MIDEARVKQMIDIADDLIVELADRGFDAAESGVVLGWLRSRRPRRWAAARWRSSIASASSAICVTSRTGALA